MQMFLGKTLTSPELNFFLLLKYPARTFEKDFVVKRFFSIQPLEDTDSEKKLLRKDIGFT